MRRRRPIISEEQRATLTEEIDIPGGLKRTRYQTLACVHCGGIHLHACPRVKRLEFEPNSQRLVSVEFWPDGAWETTHIIWPWHVFASTIRKEEESDSGNPA